MTDPVEELARAIDSAVELACADAPDVWTAFRRGVAIGRVLGAARAPERGVTDGHGPVEAAT